MAVGGYRRFYLPLRGRHWQARREVIFLNHWQLTIIIDHGFPYIVTYKIKSCLTNSSIHQNTRVGNLFYNQEGCGFLWEIGRPVTLGRHSSNSFSGQSGASVPLDRIETSSLLQSPFSLLRSNGKSLSELYLPYSVISPYPEDNVSVITDFPSVQVSLEKWYLLENQVSVQVGERGYWCWY